MAVLRYISVLLFLSVSISCISISWSREIIYRDDMGRVVKIPVPVKRAVFLTTPELVPCLNIWDKVVGIARWAYTDDELLRAVKPNWKDIVVPVGSGCGQYVNIEVLVKLKPDLVITWAYCPEEVRFMEEKGLRVIAIYFDSLPKLYDVINLYGRLFDRKREAKKTIAQMEKIFTLIRDRVSKIPTDQRRKVLWLFGRPTTVACKGSIPADMFERIGGINPASGIVTGNSGSAEVSIERIVAWNPEVIFIWEYAPYKAQDILNNPQLRHIKAVKDGRVYKAPKRWSAWSPILAPLTLWTASKTYPEYFKDIDFEKICNDFYRKVFGIPYSKVKPIED